MFFIIVSDLLCTRSVTNVIFLALGASKDLAAFLCFSIAVLFLGTALVCFAAVTKSGFYQHFVGEGGDQKKEDEQCKIK